MTQTIVLQDDEIERLRDRLSILRDRLSKSEKKYVLGNDRRRHKIEDLTDKLTQIREHHLSALSALYSNHRVLLAKAQERHSQALSDFKEQSAHRLKEASRPLPPDDDETFAGVLREITDEAEGVVSRADEKTQRQIQETKDGLEKLKAQARLNRGRIDALRSQIADSESAIRKERTKHELALADLGVRTRIAEESVKTSVSALGIALEDIKTATEEPIEPTELRAQVREARRRVTEQKQKLEKRKAHYEEKFRRLAAERATQETALASERLGTTRLDLLLEKQRKERQKAAELQRKITEQDPELNALREENLELLRSVNEQDYKVHGRKGSHQRLSRVGTPRPSAIAVED
jgi:chromosome segregation ATPase